MKNHNQTSILFIDFKNVDNNADAVVEKLANESAYMTLDVFFADKLMLQKMARSEIVVAFFWPFGKRTHRILNVEVNPYSPTHYWVHTPEQVFVLLGSWEVSYREFDPQRDVPLILFLQSSGQTPKHRYIPSKTKDKKSWHIALKEENEQKSRN